MKQILFAGLMLLGPVYIGLGQTDVVKEASKLEESGHFKEAGALLRSAIDSKKASGAELKTLEFDYDRLARIRQDFWMTRDDLFGELKGAIRDLKPEEVDTWIKDGWVDGREINGTLHFFDSGTQNLFYRHPELNARRTEHHDKAQQDRLMFDIVDAIKKAALAEKTPYVLPKTFHVTMNVTAGENVVPAGETVRAWVPIPRHYPFQTDFKLISSSWPPKSVADENSPIRSVYFEQPAKANQPTRFRIEYEYKFDGVSFDLKPEKIQPYDPNDEAVKRFTGESPHVVFTPEIRALSAQIMGNETNPMLKAKKIYDWQSNHLLYSYAIEYSTIRNLGDYCRANNFGDCGQLAMLFITLCRYNGVPARWQSGWNLFPNDTSNHDWAEIYLAPYGWVPVDPWAGNHAMRYIKTLTMAQKLEIRDFYFGGLDQYRMVANSDHSQTLDPPKQSFRSDDIDFQRGELEHGGKNIYFNQSSFGLHYKELPSPSLP